MFWCCLLNFQLNLVMCKFKWQPASKDIDICHFDSYILFSSRSSNSFNHWCEMQINYFSILLVRSALSWRKWRRRGLNPPIHLCNYFSQKYLYQTFKRSYPREMLLRKIKMKPKITWWLCHIFWNLVKVQYRLARKVQKACTNILYILYILSHDIMLMYLFWRENYK